MNNLSVVRFSNLFFPPWCVSTLPFSFFPPFLFTGCKISLWLLFFSSLGHVIYFVCWVSSLSSISYRSTSLFVLLAITRRDFCVYPIRCTSNFHIAILHLKKYCNRFRISSIVPILTFNNTLHNQKSDFTFWKRYFNCRFLLIIVTSTYSICFSWAKIISDKISRYSTCSTTFS